MRNFFDSNEFCDVICRVAGDDVLSFRKNNEWLENHPADALLFRDVEDCWNGLKAVYINNFSALVYGEFPGERSKSPAVLRLICQLYAWQFIGIISEDRTCEPVALLERIRDTGKRLQIGAISRLQLPW